MKSYTLHNEAYYNFRKYLDNTYKNGVISLSTGYPEPGEFPLPKVILAEMAAEINGIEKKRPGYGWDAGSMLLREYIVQFENMLHGTKYGVTNICMVAGATYAFNRIVETLFMNDSKRKLMIVAPTYYRMLYKAQYYADVYSVIGQEENDFQITVDEIIENLDDNTKAIFIANPTNPTYKYYTNDFFELLIPKLKERKIYLIIDESGDAFNLGVGINRLKRFPSVLDEEYVIRIVTASKKYLYAEYRIGYVLASSTFMGDKTGGFIKNIGDDIGNAPLAINDALIKIMQEEIDLLNQRINDNDFWYQMNYNNQKMIALKNIAKMNLKKCYAISSIIEPDSNFNITFKIDMDNYDTDMDLFIDLVNESKISILPCSGLGVDGKLKYFRLTYGINESNLINGLNTLISFIESSIINK